MHYLINNTLYIYINKKIIKGNVSACLYVWELLGKQCNWRRGCENWMEIWMGVQWVTVEATLWVPALGNIRFGGYERFRGFKLLFGEQ